jgi:hypothetical protein
MFWIDGWQVEWVFAAAAAGVAVMLIAKASMRAG